MNKLIVIIAVVLLAVGCNSGGDSYTTDYNYQSENKESTPEPVVENPYSSGSGHYAGYEWAEQNGVSSCDGNSQSFIEGCEEFLQQDEAHAEWEDNN